MTPLQTTQLWKVWAWAWAWTAATQLWKVQGWQQSLEQEQPNFGKFGPAQWQARSWCCSSRWAAFVSKWWCCCGAGVSNGWAGLPVSRTAVWLIRIFFFFCFFLRLFCLQIMNLI
jgi:hypothetical protein